MKNENGDLTLVPQRRLHNPVEHKDVVGSIGLSRLEFDASNNPGCQFAQTRGLFILDTTISLFAILLIGIVQVSSVMLTPEVGVTLRKSEKISFLQFRGSDILVLYQSKSNVSMTVTVGTHYMTETIIAQAFPI